MKGKNVSEEAVAGLSAGIVGTILGYPLDVVKTRMQTASAGGGASATSSKSNSIVSTSIHIIRTESIRSLYKGVGPPLVSLSILNTVTFSLYSIIQEQYNAKRGWDIRNGLAGGTIGPIAAIVSTVENLIKTQMQLDVATGKRYYTSSLHCVQQLVQQRRRQQQQQQRRQQFGISVLYTGHLINVSRESTFLFTYFYMYEGLRRYLLQLNSSNNDTNNNNNNNTSTTTLKYAIPIAGGLSGAIAWFVSFPLDLVRARIQGCDLQQQHGTTTTTTTTSSTRTQSSALSIFVQLVKNQGIVGLYSGVTPSILRAFIVSGSRFSAYETSLYLLRGGRDV